MHENTHFYFHKQNYCYDSHKHFRFSVTAVIF